MFITVMVTILNSMFDVCDMFILSMCDVFVVVVFLFFFVVYSVP